MKILLINPPIYDFTAYSLWAKPIALLKIASILEQNNIKYYYIDTLDVSSLTNEDKKKYKIKIKKDGRHNYIKVLTEKPECYEHFPRNYYRFGIPAEQFIKNLKNIPSPDYVIVTSIMTYWYPGAFEVIKIIKEVFPYTKVIFGGIYVNLCYNHAKKFSKADYIVTSIDDILKILNLKNFPFKYFPLNLYKKNFFAPIYTSYGCPYSCVYCANKFLNKPFFQKHPDDVFKEILFYFNKFNIENFAFYDDALLINKENHFIPFIKKIIKSNLPIQFFTPNGLHVSEITEEVAFLMKNANFKDIRLSLETANETLQRKIGFKTDNKHFINAVKNLQKAGFKKDEISVYLLVGIPYQTVEEIKTSVDFVKQFNVKVKLAEYSPIPHTKLWKESLEVSKYPINEEPLLQNNKILPVSVDELSLKTLNEIKKLAHSN